MNDTIADRPVVVVYDSDAQTGVAYLRDVRGQTLEFYNAAKKGFEIRDRETNSMWDVRGRLVQGVHRETKPEFVPSFISKCTVGRPTTRNQNYIGWSPRPG